MMSKNNTSTSEDEDEAMLEFSAASLEDTISLTMQNAVSTQQGMQVITNTSVASGCALILKQGSS